jgi:Prophage protein (DUF1660)
MNLYDQQSPPEEYYRNFAILIPTGPYKPLPPKKISRLKKIMCLLFGHQWRNAGISYMGTEHPRRCKRCKKMKLFKKLPDYRWIDRLLRPLCYVGLHRWKGYFGFSTYSIGGNDSPPYSEQIYKCPRCKKFKRKVVSK